MNFVMDPSKRKRRLSTELECSICLETYTKPKVLPCGHTFCLSCLLSLPLDADRITCPQCRKQHNIPVDGMEQFTDNFVVISILDMSLHAPTSVCEDCGEKGHTKFCDHCQKDVCEKCCELHLTSVLDIKSEIDKLHNMFYSPPTVRNIRKNAAKWQTSLDNIVRERAKMDKYFTNCIAVLESRRKMHNNNFDTLAKLHAIFLRCSDLQASKLLGDKLREDFMRSVATCTNIRKLDDIKSSVSELLEVSQLMLTIETGDSFAFAGDVTKITNLSSLGDITFDGFPLANHGKRRRDVINDVTASTACAGPSYESPFDIPTVDMKSVVAGDQSCHEEGHIAGGAGAIFANVPETTRLPVNYMNKVGGTAIIAASGATGGCLYNPTGATYCSHTNTILVADNGNRRIMRYDMDGSNGRNFVRDGDKMCVDYMPYDVATSKSGGVFVTDNHNQRVLVFTRDGDYVTSLGSRGTGDGQFGKVRGITCHNGCVLVCDHGRSRVTMLTEDGGYIRHIAFAQSKPQYVAVGPDDTIYVTNCDVTKWPLWRSKVHVYRWDGSPVRQFGKREAADCTWPGGVTVDHQGYVCVAWCGHNRVDVFNSQGYLHTTFGKPGDGSGELGWPLGLELLPDGRIMVCDSSNHRLQIF